MNYKKQLGQFYTTNSSYITQNLLNIFPKNAEVIDPFSGNWDLLNLLKENTLIGYDIDPKNVNTIKMNTLSNPPSYINKWIFTNPPFLAKNKNKDKSLYNIYNTDDYYKIALKTISDCNGGIIILPLNFFCSQDVNIRKEFLSNFLIQQVNVFEEQVFDDTNYTVCSFSFIKKENFYQNINFTIFPEKKNIELLLKDQYGYTIGDKLLFLKKSNVKISRLLKNQIPNSNIFLKAIDSSSINKDIGLSIKEHYYGKNTDRTYATICFSKEFSIIEQKLIVDKFNEKIKELREEYYSLFLTNYREFGRKRIGFDLAYNIISNIILENSLDKKH